MKKKLSRFAVAILAFVLAVSPVGCGMNTTGGKGPDEEIVNSITSMKTLEGDFSDILIKDEESAIKAASESAKELGYENALNELQGFYTTTVDGETYYRLQQTYQGIPVYGRYVVVVADDSGKAISLNTDVRDLPESLNTQITVNDAQIAKGIKEYAALHWKELNDVLKFTSVSKADKVIYDLDEGEEARVCVKLYVTNGGEVYEVVADGETGAVRSAVSTIKTLSATGTDGTKNFPVNVGEDGTYTLGDEERDITVFYFNGGSSNDMSSVNQLPVTSAGDSVFGNAPEETDIHCQRAVDFYTTALKIVDYYQDTFGQGIPFGSLDLGYDDMRKGGNNASGGSAISSDSDPKPGSPYATLYLGANLPADSYELIGHEYTHCIQYGLDAAVEESDPGIMEGIADIFGFFFDAYCTGSIDWDMDLTIAGVDGHRNAVSPGSYNYPSTVLEKNKSGQAADHAYATVISRIAYLMYDSGEFPLDELQMIWYKTLCRLPHTASYGHLRDCLKQAVEAKYGVSSVQSELLSDILNEVGIVSDPYFECNNKIKLSVYDRNREPYDDYLLRIEGVKITGILKKEERFEQEAAVNSSAPYELDLPNGTYTCTVTDNADVVDIGSRTDVVDIRSRTKTFILYVNKKHTNDVAECFTEFGSDFVAAPGAKLTVLDAIGNDYKDYEAIATKRLQKIVINDGVLNLPVHNNYYVQLTNTKGNTAQRDAFILRIKEGGKTEIVKETEFIGGSIIKGKVVDSETQKPLSGVKVQYTNQNNPDETGSVLTDAEGLFRTDYLTEGRIKISFSLERYAEMSTETDVNSEPHEYNLGVVQMKTFDLETQLKVIADNYSQWNRLITGYVPRTTFMVSDINNNGRLELILSGTYGTGMVSENYVFEVNKDNTGLIECSFMTENAPDLQFDDSAAVYLVNGNYMIACADGNPHGVMENHVTSQTMSLQNTDIVVEELGSASVYFSPNGPTREEYYDKDGNSISKDEYDGLFDSTYSGYPKGVMKFNWVPLYGAESVLQSRLKESWEGFSCSLFEK